MKTLAILLLLALTPTPILVVRSTQANCFEPCDATFVVSIEPAEDNAYVSLEFIGDDNGFYQYSEWPLSPKSPKPMRVGYKRLGGGQYRLRTTVYKHDAKTWVAAT